MKYEFLVREKCKNSSDKTDENIKINEDNSFIGSTMLSTYEDFNIFLKKKQDKNIDNKNIDDTNNNDNEKKNKEITDNKHSIKKDNPSLFESEKKTVETIVKYSSSFLSLLLNFIYMLKNAFVLLISKKKLNTNSIINKDIEIINRFNKKKNKHDKNIEKNDNKYIEKNKKYIEKNNKHIEKNNKNIKKINSYFLELD
jgi:hypothetical protein